MFYLLQELIFEIECGTECLLIMYSCSHKISKNYFLSKYFCDVYTTVDDYYCVV